MLRSVVGSQGMPCQLIDRFDFAGRSATGCSACGGVHYCHFLPFAIFARFWVQLLSVPFVSTVYGGTWVPSNTLKFVLVPFFFVFVVDFVPSQADHLSIKGRVVGSLALLLGAKLVTIQVRWVR